LTPSVSMLEDIYYPFTITRANIKLLMADLAD